MAQAPVAATSREAAIARKVRGIVAEQLGIGEDEVLPSSQFVDDLGADSLDIVEVVMAVEEEFEMEIPESDAEGFEHVKDLIDYLLQRVD